MMKSMFAMVLVVALFVSGCESASEAGYDNSEAAEASISVEFPEELMTDSSATMIISWKGDIREGIYTVSLGDKRVLFSQDFRLTKHPFRMQAMSLVSFLKSDTIYLIHVSAISESGAAVEVDTAFKTKPVAPPSIKLSAVIGVSSTRPAFNWTATEDVVSGKLVCRNGMGVYTITMSTDVSVGMSEAIITMIFPRNTSWECDIEATTRSGRQVVSNTLALLTGSGI